MYGGSHSSHDSFCRPGSESSPGRRTIPPLIAPVNEPWFHDKPKILNTSTPLLFPAKKYNPLPELNLQPIPDSEPGDLGYHQRVSSSWVPEDKAHVKLEPLSNTLDRELHGKRKWDVSQLLEYMFSDEILGLPISKLAPEILAGFEQKGLISNGAFTTRLNFQEANAASFLNNTTRELEKILKTIKAPRGFEFKPPIRCRKWSSQRFDHGLSDSPIFRKPNLILLDMPLLDPYSSSPSDEIPWVKIKAFGEVTSRNTFHRDLKSAIDTKTYILFLTQHDRNFVPAIAFFGDHFVFSVTDRESQQFSRCLLLHDVDRPDDIMVFLRILLGLMFSTDHVLGLDMTMRRNEKHEIKSIYVEGQKYNVVKLVYSVESLLGRATKVWQVERGGRIYVLKDSWVITSRPLESDMLKDLKIKRVIGVPQIVAGGVVLHPEFTRCNHPAPLRTSLFRFSKLSHNLEARERRRVVEGPQAEPLSSFKTRLEVFVAFRDYVEALEAMVNAGWVHWDISYNNVMLYTPSDEYPAKPYADTESAQRGTLIDLDHTAQIQKTRNNVQGSFGGRTGTAPYMALSILINNGKNILHTPQHDLESLLYILFNIFTSTDGPGNLRVIEGASDLPLLEWFEDISSYKKLGRIKQGQLADFSYAIKNYFTDYWKPLTDVAHALFHITFPNGLDGHAPKPQIQHGQMVTILNSTIFFLSQSSDDNIFPRIMTMPSTRKSSICGPSVSRSGPTYPTKRSVSRIEASSSDSEVVPPGKKSRTVTKRSASRAEASLEEEAPPRKSSRTGKTKTRTASKAETLEEEAVPSQKRSHMGKTTKRSVSRVEGASEESAPPRKRSRTHGGLHSRGLSSAHESADTSLSVDNLSTTRICRPSQNQTSALQTTSTGSSCTQYRTTSSSSRATPESSTSGRWPTHIPSWSWP